MGAPAALGTPAASFATYGPADKELVERSRHALLHAVYFGSALTGGGVESLKAGIVGLLPAAAGDSAAPVSGRVFKIERDPDGGWVAYVRMFSGVVRVRDRLPGGKVTAIHVFADGGAARRDCVVAGQIANCGVSPRCGSVTRSVNRLRCPSIISRLPPSRPWWFPWRRPTAHGSVWRWVSSPSRTR
jgi:hypothetical protein